jgi:hypothetical protein
MHKTVIKLVDLSLLRSIHNIILCRITLLIMYHTEWICLCQWEIWWCLIIRCTSKTSCNHKWTISRIALMTYLEISKASRVSNIFSSWFTRQFNKINLVSKKELKTSMIARIFPRVLMIICNSNKNMIVRML